MGQQARCDLAIGGPVRGYWRPGRDQFLGHHVAVQVPQFVAAVSLRDGQPEEACYAKARREFLVPLTEPGVDRRLPAELGAVGPQEVPYREALFDQLRLAGGRHLRGTHRMNSLDRRHGGR